MLDLDNNAYRQLYNDLDLPHDVKIAVGVSGGADSTCLALLEASRNPAMVALICDHGLRQESANEAQLVKQRMDAHGIPNRVLSLGMNVGTAIQERARSARYGAMVQAMLELGFEPGKGALLVAHHKSDQAETVLFREQMGSGARGLAGMQSVRAMECFQLARPLLPVHKQEIKDMLISIDEPWIEDPSNQNPKFTRVRIRNYLADKPDLIEELWKKSKQAGEQRKESEERALVRIAEAGGQEKLSAIQFKLDQLGDDETSQLALRMMIEQVAPLYAAIEIQANSLNRLIEQGSGSLGGALLFPGRAGSHWLAREPAWVEQDVMASAWQPWDNRFRAPPRESGLDIGCVGAFAGKLRKLPLAENIPAKVLQTLPAFKKNGRVVAVPSLEWGNWLASPIPLKNSLLEKTREIAPFSSLQLNM